VRFAVPEPVREIKSVGEIARTQYALTQSQQRDGDVLQA